MKYRTPSYCLYFGNEKLKATTLNPYRIKGFAAYHYVIRPLRTKSISTIDVDIHNLNPVLLDKVTMN